MEIWDTGSNRLDTYDLEELAAALVGLFDYHCAVSLLIRSRLEKEVAMAGLKIPSY